MAKINEIIQKYLEDLENTIISLEKEYHSLEQEEEDYHLSQDLLEILLTSKDAFIEGILSRTEEQQLILENFLKKILKSNNEVDRIYDEARNMYYLKAFGLDTKKEAIPQKSQIEDTLNNLIEAIIIYQQNTSLEEVTNQQEEISNKMNKIMEIGSTFNETNLESDIKDIDFFSTTLEESSLSSEEKELLLLHILEKTSKLYEETLNNRKNNKEATITKEIKSLLENKEIREKVFSKINKEYEKELAEDTLLAIATEELTIRMILKSLTLEDALLDFYDTYQIEELENNELNDMFIDNSNKEENNDNQRKR